MLLVLIATAIAIFVLLAMLPGKIAKNRNHPQQSAVNVAGWLGALLGGVFWPLALIWAFYVHRGQNIKSPPEEPAS